VSISGFLFKPDGPGPFPAVILLHGCDGLGWHRPRQGGWLFSRENAQRFVRLGFVALVLDSFEPRHVDQACGKPLTVSPWRRAWDALSAARFLAGLGFVDAERIVVEGRSHGAVAVLVAMERDRWRVPEHFAAGVAWYPGCSWNKAGMSAPVLILIGEADDWTKAAECRRLVEQFAPNAHEGEIVLRTYPGATHAFDAPGELRYIVGHRIEYDPGATADAWMRVEEFLRERLK
jgi:dienelactone hydrolase